LLSFLKTKRGVLQTIPQVTFHTVPVTLFSKTSLRGMRKVVVTLLLEKAGSTLFLKEKQCNIRSLKEEFGVKI